MALLIILPVLMRFLLPPRPVAAAAVPELAFPYVRRLQAHFQTLGVSRPPGNWFQQLILALAWFGLTLALMQPQLVDHFTQVQNKGYDLMLAVDLSGSMEALDFTANGRRISRHKVIEQVVSDFVAQRQGDRLGLVLFGSNAYLQIPLTHDTASVRKLLNNTRVGEAGDATAIGDAIGLAVKNLRDRPEQSRAIILLTDGGDNASTVPPLAAAKLAASYGIRIFTIGVGSDGPVPIPDQNGQVVMAQMDLDEGLLRKIADLTGGAYFRASDTAALQNSYRAIDKLEKTTSEEQDYAIRTPLFRYPLGAAMALLVIVALLPLYRRVRHGS